MTSEPIHEDGTFTGADGLKLYCRTWRPRAHAARGALVNVHGLGDHSGLYETVVEHFVSRGWAVHAFDHRGNGRSPGRRGHVEDWSLYREDLRRFVLRTRERERGPIVVLGTSLGAVVALDYALHHPEHLTGVAAAAPALGRPNVPGWMLPVGRVMSRFWPAFSLDTGLDLSGLSRDPEAAARVTGDPLFHRRASARLATELAGAAARVYAGARKFRVPVLLLHGGADRMVPPEGTRVFAALADPAMVTYREYPGAYHALFADIDHPAVLADLERWIAARTG
ncbi:MAG TPA: alpha/beta hydrolase [Gemmatimonadales bacterium]|nr:alpha/beta hydrolase [Gemmatimonadales bacterium]